MARSAIATVLLLSACDAGTESLGPSPTGRIPPIEPQSVPSEIACGNLATAADVCLRADHRGQLIAFDPVAINDACVLDAFVPPGTNSIGWLGNDAYACGGDGDSVVRVSLDGGSVDRRPSPGCGSVTGGGDRLVVVGSDLDIFDRFDDIPHGPVRTLEFDATTSRSAIFDDTYYGAWHSSDQIDRIDLDDGRVLTPLLLDYDDWNFGLAALSSGELLLVRRERISAGLERIDPSNGALLGRTVPAAWTNGNAALTCGGKMPMRSPPPSIADPVHVFGDCDAGLSVYDSGADGVEIHVVGVYEPTAGTVAVDIDRDGPVHLVLNAYEAAAWTITASSRTEIVSIRVFGNGQQTAMAPVGVALVVEGEGTPGEDRPSALAYSWRSYEARVLASDLRALYGEPIRSFSGCYHASRIEIR